MGCWWMCFCRRTRKHRSRSFWTWMRPTIRCTESRKGVSFTATMDTTAICRSTSSAGSSCYVRGLRPSNIDGAAGSVQELKRIVQQIRCAWPAVHIIVRGDSGFCREELMAWCEAEAVDYLLGLAKNERLKAEIQEPMKEAEALCRQSGRAARVFHEFVY